MNGGRSVNGALILVLGILSIVMLQILGPVAWILGNSALATLDAGLGDESERGMVNAGRICGIIGTVLLIVGAVSSFLFGIAALNVFWHFFNAVMQAALPSR